MIRSILEDCAALVSLALFTGMISLFAQGMQGI